ncbi:hypothetical protein ABZ876_21695 [Streptomyces sp. NPDC046931]|uniref:hypothetical protein n=1 Tax=Streptomyces sp. NPDC046931 TaxID=3154806 RepID=UPI0033DC9800
MRVLPARRFASSALCALMITGIAGPAAVAADHASARGRAPAEASLPPNADVLVRPVNDLLAAVLKADHNRLPADEAARLGKAVDDAIAKVSMDTATTSPGTDEDDTFAGLRQAIDRLLAAATSANTSQVAPAATAVVTELVKVLATGFLTGGLLPLPNPSVPSTLPSLPALPSAKPSPPHLLTPMPSASHMLTPMPSRSTS